MRRRESIRAELRREHEMKRNDQAAGFRLIEQVAVLCAYRTPFASRIRDSATATLRPTCMTLPVALMRPVASVTGRMKFIFSSIVGAHDPAGSWDMIAVVIAVS